MYLHWKINMDAPRGDLRRIVILGLLLLSLAACTTSPETPYSDGMLLNTPLATSDQATMAVALTQNKSNADNQAAATAEIVRANAQTTLNSADATLSAVRTQQQNNADVIAAQITGTAEMVRAAVQATLGAAGSTQSAALTQDAIRQTQMADLATTDAQALITQQNKNELVAGTQTAAANNSATQAAAVTSQWIADEARLREAQNGNPLASLWMWFLTIFIVLFAGLALWGFWTWLQIQQANQHILESPAGAGRYQLTEPDDQVRLWLAEVKRKLLSGDHKDEDDNTTR